VEKSSPRARQDGRFVFDNLPAGEYVLSVKPPPPPQPTSSTVRSAIKNPSSVVKGVQVVKAAVELGVGPASAVIKITTAKGKITGLVTRKPIDQQAPGTPEAPREPPPPPPPPDTSKNVPEGPAQSK
jgi:hypothetical protein